MRTTCTFKALRTLRVLRGGANLEDGIQDFQGLEVGLKTLGGLRVLRVLRTVPSRLTGA